MGHKVVRTVYKLRFEDGPLAGSVIRGRSISTDGFLEIARLQEAARAESAAGNTGAQLAATEALFDRIAAVLVDWDLEEEDGTPIPCTRAGLGILEPSMTGSLIDAWMEAVQGVPPPLAPGSPNGGPSLEPFIPMAPLSPSPAN